MSNRRRASGRSIPATPPDSRVRIRRFRGSLDQQTGKEVGQPPRSVCTSRFLGIKARADVPSAELREPNCATVRHQRQTTAVSRCQLRCLDQHALQMLAALLEKGRALDDVCRTLLGATQPAVTDRLFDRQKSFHIPRFKWGWPQLQPVRAAGLRPAYPIDVR